MPHVFHLKKWYLDLITEDGRVFIGYVAHIRWWLLSIHYHGYLFLDAQGQVHHVNRFRRAKSPEQTAGQICWRAPGIRGEWNATCSSYRETLLQNAHGSIDWHCLMPAAEAKVVIESQEAFIGRGYVEHIEMSLPPWKFPIHRLYWGRYLSQQDHVVWIRWVSEQHPKVLLFHNGNRHEQATIESESLQFNDYRLAMQDSCTLRSGSLGSTVLSHAGWLKKLIPRSMLTLSETKWRSQGNLFRQNSLISQGWAIHETVDWSTG
ncbi:MAG: hypothetical protein JNJ77_19010 [Planctomycetia bacterium]|nr:hypothetical protein [Planctomycetia bacterium]